MNVHPHAVADTIVAIGASAGGLEALEQFFRNCPTDLGITYVVVQHLSPDHKSMMDDLLARYTQMPVVMVKSDVAPLPDTVYLIPAGTHIEIEEGRFKVTQKLPHTFSLPIDIFFKSVAKSFGNKSIAVILSGTGSDGSLGIADINAVGGLVIVQQPTDAKFDGMPTSAIHTGAVHDVLPVREIPTRLKHYLENPGVGFNNLDIEPQTELEQIAARDDIFAILNNEFHINFADYKVGTIGRRIERRMQLKHLKNLREYANLLQVNAAELDTLRGELLIPVTSFFRDRSVFELLAQEVIPEIIAHANPLQGIRCWVAGCSTGEEAYSLVMLFLEAFEQRNEWLPLKVFATDINQDNLDIASNGHYPATILSELSTDHLNKFFDVDVDGYRVKPQLRQAVVFAKHNLLQDAPFTRMDLVSCRNTLIYFKNMAQDLVLQKLQYAVVPDGFLTLGISESMTINSSSFHSLDTKLKVFQRNHTPLSHELRGQFALAAKPAMERVAHPRLAREHFKDTWVEQAREMVLQQFAPPAMLVDHTGKVIHLYGDVQSLLQLRHGAAEFTLNKVLPDKLQPVASALLHKCKREGGNYRSEFVRFNDAKGQESSYQVVAQTLEHKPESQVLLAFVRAAIAPTLPATPVELSHELSDKINALEVELQATRESLQATIEELETSNEELQATNEELMASNEEMQSANEELQSVNEELNTVNSEYHEKMVILNRINADLDSMSRAAGIATLFVDQNKTVTRYTPDAIRLFKIRDSDIGRPVDEIVSRLQYNEFSQDLAITLNHERTIEREVKSTDGVEFLVRILPYRISSGAIGAVATFVDITPLKASQQLQILLNALPEHVAVLDKFGQIVLVNSAWEQFARVNGDPTLAQTCTGANYLDACEQAAEQDPFARRAYLGIKSVLEGSKSSFQMSYPCHSPAENRWFVMHAVSVKHGQFAAVVSHVNVTDWIIKEQQHD